MHNVFYLTHHYLIIQLFILKFETYCLQTINHKLRNELSFKSIN